MCHFTRGIGSRGFCALLALATPALAQAKHPWSLNWCWRWTVPPVSMRVSLICRTKASPGHFRDPEVLQAVDNLRPYGAAIAIVQWGGPGETQVVLPFTHIENARDAKAFGFRVSLVRRWMRASSTSIATGINDARGAYRKQRI